MKRSMKSTLWQCYRMRYQLTEKRVFKISIASRYLGNIASTVYVSVVGFVAIVVVHFDAWDGASSQPRGLNWYTVIDGVRRHVFNAPLSHRGYPPGVSLYQW